MIWVTNLISLWTTLCQRLLPDLGIIDDLTIETFLQRVPRSVLESSAYELSDAESPQIPVPPSPIPALNLGYIATDPDDVRGCTQKLELYCRIAMEVQDVDAQPLYYGNKPRPGGVEVTSTQWSRCHVYLKLVERLRVR